MTLHTTGLAFFLLLRNGVFALAPLIAFFMWPEHGLLIGLATFLPAALHFHYGHYRQSIIADQREDALDEHMACPDDRAKKAEWERLRDLYFEWHHRRDWSWWYLVTGALIALLGMKEIG